MHVQMQTWLLIDMALIVIVNDFPLVKRAIEEVDFVANKQFYFINNSSF